MADADQLAAHLEFFKELGIDGMRRDSVWRARSEPPPALAEPASADGVTRVVPEPAGSAPGDPLTIAPPAVPLFATEEEALRALRADIGEECSRCKLHSLGRRQIVFGVGNPNADLMFVGEAPGADEDI